MLKRKIMASTILAFLFTLFLLCFDIYHAYKTNLSYSFMDAGWLVFILFIYLYPIIYLYSIPMGLLLEYYFKTPLSFYVCLLYLILGSLFMFISTFLFNPFFLTNHFISFLQQLSTLSSISLISSFFYWCIDSILYKKEIRKERRKNPA